MFSYGRKIRDRDMDFLSNVSCYIRYLRNVSYHIRNMNMTASYISCTIGLSISLVLSLLGFDDLAAALAIGWVISSIAIGVFLTTRK